MQNCACRPINRLQKASSGEQALGPGGIVTVLCQLDVSFTSDYCQKRASFYRRCSFARRYRWDPYSGFVIHERGRNQTAAGDLKQSVAIRRTFAIICRLVNLARQHLAYGEQMLHRISQSHAVGTSLPPLRCKRLRLHAIVFEGGPFSVPLTAACQEGEARCTALLPSQVRN